MTSRQLVQEVSDGLELLKNRVEDLEESQASNNAPSVRESRSGGWESLANVWVPMSPSSPVSLGLSSIVETISTANLPLDVNGSVLHEDQYLGPDSVQ